MYDGGARAIGMPVPIGRIAPGAAGDLALIDLDTEAFTPLNDARRQMVCRDRFIVRHVVVAGRIVVRDGRLTTVDEKALRAEARDCAKAYRAETEAAERAAVTSSRYYAAMVPPLFREAWQAHSPPRSFVGRGNGISFPGGARQRLLERFGSISAMTL